jgi:hypothetical protein
MNLIKYGIASVVVTCAVAVACGGSSSGDGNGSGAGTSSSSGGTSNSAGTSSSTAGTTSNTTGGTATSAGGTTATGAGGTLTGIGACDGSGTLPPAASSMCPAFATCAETNCKTQLKACDATGFENCAITSCFNEALACGSMGTGGNGAGGSLSFGGNAGTFPSFDAGTQTCADLATCCAKQTDAQTKAQCDMVVSQKLDFACSIVFSSLSCT